MDKLTKEEVLHVAHLARIAVTENEIEKYQKDFKEIEVEDNNLLVTPVSYQSTLRSDSSVRSVEFNEIKKNVPATTGNFVEVPVMVSE